ncbi:MAG: RagB/SusD family nutrient uptake outer membrane protein [Bacteroidota bacterium]
MKTFKYTFILAAALIFGSCKDLLDVTPTDRIAVSDFWTVESDAVYGANAVYSLLSENANKATGDASHFISWDGMTDIGYTHLPQSPESFILQGQYDALNSRVYNDYINLYAGIRAANTFMDNVGNIQGANAANITRLTGEVRVLRAYFYSRLVALFGDVAIVTTSLDLEQGRSVSRNTASEVYDFISKELTEAADQLPVTAPDKGRVSKATALGLNARAMLYAGRFQDAANAAQAVMAMTQYGLYPTYATMFTSAAENSKEVLFDIQYLSGVNTTDIFNVLTPSSVVAGKSLFVPTKVMVDAYYMKNGLPITDPTSGFDPKLPYKNRDPRLSFSVFVPGDNLPNAKVFNPLPDSKTGDAVGSTFNVSPTGFNLKKYVNTEDAAKQSLISPINFILLRYAEVLLTYAEAKVELNQIDQSVYDAIDAIRQRSDVLMPKVDPGQSQGLDARHRSS